MIKAERTALPMWRRGDRPPFEGHNSELIFLYRSSVCFIKAKVLSRWQRTVVQMYIYKRGGRFSEGFLSSRQVNIKASPLRCNMWIRTWSSEVRPAAMATVNGQATSTALVRRSISSDRFHPFLKRRSARGPSNIATTNRDDRQNIYHILNMWASVLENKTVPKYFKVRVAVRGSQIPMALFCVGAGRVPSGSRPVKAARSDTSPSDDAGRRTGSCGALCGNVERSDGRRGAVVGDRWT